MGLACSNSIPPQKHLTKMEALPSEISSAGSGVPVLPVQDAPGLHPDHGGAAVGG